MIAETNIPAGGERIILAAFHDNSQATSDTGSSTVNELISICPTSKAALEQLYMMFKGTVFTVAFGITADYHLSEDCVAETFVRLTQLKRFSPTKGDGKGIILTIARNVALELRRRYKKDNDIYAYQNYGDAEKTVEDSIFINQILKHLSDKQRQIVLLKCCSEMTFREIAKLMKLPETTVKSRYKRAITILQEKAGVTNEKE